MTSQAQAASGLAGVRGLAFLSFPLHPARRPSVERAQHLAEVGLPMLFVQGTRDALAELSLLQDVAEQLGPRAGLHLIEGADHSFHVPARSGRTDSDVRREIADVVSRWIDQVVPATTV
jgi:predicted alpha/beta-hydrolase family hydrolase